MFASLHVLFCFFCPTAAKAHRSAVVPSPASVETCSPLWQHRLIPPFHAAVPSLLALVCADSRDDNREGRMSRGARAHTRWQFNTVEEDQRHLASEANVQVQ